METTLPKVMIVKSLVHREGVFSADDIFRSDLKKHVKKCRTARLPQLQGGERRMKALGGQDFQVGPLRLVGLQLRGVEDLRPAVHEHRV